MLVLTSIVLATPLVAVASAAVSPPIGVLAALLAPFQPPEKSGLHPRQVIVPPECFQECSAFLDAINVGTLTSSLAEIH
jgi:hypothetical protein